MPRPAITGFSTPSAVEQAVSVFRADVIQLAMLRVLLAHPEGITAGAIERELGMTHTAVFRRLRQLEADGALLVEHEGDNRQGFRLLYRVDAGRIRAELRRIQDWIDGLPVD